MNVWKDAALNKDAPDQPGFDDTVKAQALKKLIASVPAEFKKSAQLDRDNLLAATKQFTGKGAVRANGASGWSLKGFKSSLTSYQVIGAGFMRARETGGDEPRGGICADTMGFGKTVMSLAVFTNDKVTEGPRGTLIVVPSSLVGQWYNECFKHIKRKVTIHRQVGEYKLEGEAAETQLQTFDIVITTYHEVMYSYPKTETPVELQTSEEKQEWWSKHFEEFKGPLHRVHWNRCILDEAACIKNYQSRTSLACRALTADKRWALSGTPIMNSCTELYPYFKFLRCPYTGSFKLFKQNYYGDEPEKFQRLMLMLNKFMLRRTHRDILFGAPILKLPKGDQRIFWVQFNPLERAVYNIVKQRMIKRINAIARKGLIKENYSHVLTMLLRLRQLTGHILLVESTMQDILDKSDHELIRQLAEDEANFEDERSAQMLQLRKLLKASASQPAQGQQQMPPDTPQQQAQQDQLALIDADKEVGRQHGLTYNFGKYLETLREGQKLEDLKARSLCASCRQVPAKAFVTSCYHIYCMECLETLQHQAASRGRNKARCLECSIEYSGTAPCDDFTLDSIMSSAEYEDEEFPPVNRWRKKKDEAQLVKNWLNLPGPVLPSAKTMAMKAQILNWIGENPDVKIIIYSQFLSMIRIIEKVCDGENWLYVPYHGQMSHSARDKAIETFKKPEIRIMIASLKCGGLGLNLTMASRVISIDPWWNLSAEMQAFCRVFRIGQDQETSMTRLVVEQTVDADMIDMQDRKQREIDRVLESDNRTQKRLTVQDMMRLFGPVHEDDEGHPFIIAEDRDTLPRFNADSEDEGDEQ
ncbi:uncharacterized protein K452DRAFT_325644 [Aplosporella prunicola CBS 121167]|uniref:RING-type domain-containing protein n=1 Tax=Aplosporella prunicola CBS 121167 TaxID=1176127 RepID=A0A6A6BJA6_9PEZI|nr:uncharacterized protein K452DRAFT_325644 [Aplosporella prunicola CBS 121167]KAF2143698.1 hypothetical protein K452DRAFT_325644 [Aplosporella prunicola CBS 121167]